MSTEDSETDVPHQVTYGLAELAERSGVAPRTIRFYTTEGLLTAPGKLGREAVYTTQHLVTLELIRELQSHGFGLAAIKEHLDRLPGDVSAASIALHSTMLAPWLADRPEVLTRAQLDDRSDRPITQDDLAMLDSLGIIEPVEDDSYKVATALLSVAVELIDFGLTPDSSAEIIRAIDDAGTRLTTELEETYSQMLRPTLVEKNMTDTDVERFVALFKPVSIAALAQRYEQALVDLRQRESQKAHS